MRRPRVNFKTAIAKRMADQANFCVGTLVNFIDLVLCYAFDQALNRHARTRNIRRAARCLYEKEGLNSLTAKTIVRLYQKAEWPQWLWARFTSLPIKAISFFKSRFLPTVKICSENRIVQQVIDIATRLLL